MFQNIAKLTKNCTDAWKRCSLLWARSKSGHRIQFMWQRVISLLLFSLIFLSWNCNFLHHKRNEFKICIADHPHIDVIFLQETYSPNCNISNPTFRLYHPPRVNRTSRGDTAIYIKIHITRYKTQNTIYIDKEFTSITLQLPHTNNYLASIYTPPNGHFPVNSPHNTNIDFFLAITMPEVGVGIIMAIHTRLPLCIT